MNRTEALRAYTEWAAYAAFQETQKGTIEPGKWADLTVLSRDIMTIPVEQILSTEIMMTIVNGRIVHQKSGGKN
jgi:predicted amidohydrolase YtcJ